ncbi:MAG: hypothetical protein ACR2QZ_06040 [Woeseiaceae bacterium]
MFERWVNSNEIISLTILLLMAMALVAGQADATIQEEVRTAAALEQAQSRDVNDVSFRTTIQGHINGKVLTISIDSLPRFGLFRPERHTD